MSGANGANAAGVFSSAPSTTRPKGVEPPKRKRAHLVIESSDEEDDDEEGDGFVVPDSAGIVYEGPQGEDADAPEVDLTGAGQESDDEDGNGSDEDFQAAAAAASRGRGAATRAQKMRAVASEARANDSRDAVAAADRASMRDTSGYAASKKLKKGDKHWLPPSLRCKACSCCRAKLGCCSRAPEPCPHVAGGNRYDPTQNQHRNVLGDDNAFMDRDIDEDDFDDFEEPTSEPEEEEEAAAAPPRKSSRREEATAKHEQEVARLRQRQAQAQGRPAAAAAAGGGRSRPAKAHKGFFLAKTSPTMPAGTRSALAGAQHAPPAAARQQSIPRSMGQPQPPPQPAVSTQQAQEAQRVKVGLQPTSLFAQRKRSQICEQHK